MKSNYKRIGDYIAPVNVRNNELRAKKLLGININKHFMPSVANIIGTDLANYKLVQQNQFACNRMHVGRDYRIPVAVSTDEEPFIVSPAYDVFEVRDTKILLPEYLMMWFSRAEFDRNAWFYTDADVRGGLPWKAFEEMQLPIPNMTKQREIVKEYNTIQNRIDLNQKLIQKLEETAQAIYKQWFVEFEFPDENGKPYKSSGGEMIWCEELGKEIPKGWEYQEISYIARRIITGKTPPTTNEKNYGDYMPFVTIPDMHNNVFVETAIRFLSKEGVAHQRNASLPVGSVCVSCIGTAGLVSITAVECQTNQQINSIICKEWVSVKYIYITLKALKKHISEWGGKGSVGVILNKTEFSQIRIQIPQRKDMSNFDKVINPVFEAIKLHSRENRYLLELKKLLLSKLAIVEG